jgi:uncharacterized membrane protein
MTTFQILYTAVGVLAMITLILKGPGWACNLPEESIERFNRNGGKIYTALVSVAMLLLVGMMSNLVHNLHTQPQGKSLSETYHAIMQTVSKKIHRHS